MLFRSNLDFADVHTVMHDKGIAHIGIGFGKGDDKCIEAVKQAINSPLLETTIEGASHVIINISGDVNLIEANEAASYVQELTGEGANIILWHKKNLIRVKTQSKRKKEGQIND